MHFQPPAHRGAARAPRGPFVVAGATAGAAVLTAVLALFWSASRQDWLPPTEANAAALARCHALAGMTARADCVDAVVAEVKAAASTRRVAQLADPAADRRRVP